MLRGLFCVHGVPEEFASDSASMFVSGLKKKFMDQACIKRLFPTLELTCRNRCEKHEAVDRGEHWAARHSGH